MAGAGRLMFVAGGSGFIGANICREAIRQGFRVVSLSRTGRPEHVKEKWADLVEWRRGDIQRPKEYVEAIRPADAVVSCVGRWGFGGSPELLEANGAVNIKLAQCVHRECPNLSKFGFISHTPWSMRMQTPFRAYFQGKLQAENIIMSLFPNNYIIMRPQWVFGWRHLFGPVWLPLQVLGAPLEHIMFPLGNYYHHTKLTVPPNDVTELARVLVLGCTVGRDVSGVIAPGRVRDVLEREAQNLPLDDWLRPELLEHFRAKKEYYEETNFVEKFGIRDIRRKGWETYLVRHRLALNPGTTRPDFVHPIKSVEYLTDRFITPSFREERNEEKLLLAAKTREKFKLFEAAREQERIAGEQRLLGEVPSSAELFLQSESTTPLREAALPRGAGARPSLIAEQGQPNPAPDRNQWVIDQGNLVKPQAAGVAVSFGRA
eukprot:TRINITY_DN51219_c0_g1_i1.p1 TRINITY_DN51219_c0_g1~~TRINITY_DN51219_c0_g1_i1.p1  ORF type:complete len:432 (+),score=116.30 TRINITY_DN51219_c0_g1_i1:125-1420(+)